MGLAFWPGCIVFSELRLEDGRWVRAPKRGSRFGCGCGFFGSHGFRTLCLPKFKHHVIGKSGAYPLRIEDLFVTRIVPPQPFELFRDLPYGQGFFRDLGNLLGRQDSVWNLPKPHHKQDQIVDHGAINFDPRGKLRPGEKATVMCLACDRSQAGIVSRA